MAPKSQNKEIKAAKNTVSMPSLTSNAAGAGNLMPTPGKTEEGASPMTPKNFRNHPDMENFFRFIYENDLRLEALDIIDDIIEVRKTRRKKDVRGKEFAKEL